jgi:type I restriction enzyme, S subunit
MDIIEIKNFEVESFKGVNCEKGETGEYFFIPSGAVFPREIKKNKCWKIKELDFEKIKEEKHLRDGDILFNTGGVGTLGRSAYFEKKHFDNLCVSDAFVMVLRNNDKRLLSKYLFYFLQTDSISRDIIKSTIGSTGITSIRRDDILKFKIPLLPFQTQEKIVQILEQAEQLKQKREQVDKLIDDYLKSVFNDMFLKKDFGLQKLNEICNNISVGIVIKPAQYYVDKGVPALRSLNVKPNKIVAKNFVYVSKEDNDTKILKSKVFKGDLVVVRSGAPGTAAVIPEYLDGINCIDLVIIRPNRRLVDSVFLSFTINSDFFKNKIFEGTKGAAQQHFNVGSVKELEIPLPPIDLQRQFASIVEKVEKIKESQKNSKQEIDNLFNALMQQSFRGEIKC